MSDYQDPAQVVQALSQAAQEETRKLYADGNAIRESMRQRYGAATSDATTQDLSAKLGDAGVDQLIGLVRHHHHAPDILVHLGNNPGQLEKLSRMTLAEANTELARIESQMSPHGRARGGGEPAWRQAVAQQGSTSEDDWRTNYADDVLDDNEWSRRWDRRELRKMGRPE